MLELRHIIKEELERRASLEQRGVEDPGEMLPRFRLDLVEQNLEDYDEKVSIFVFDYFSSPCLFLSCVWSKPSDCSATLGFGL